MSNFSMTDRVSNLRKHTQSSISGKPKRSVSTILPTPPEEVWGEWAPDPSTVSLGVVFEQTRTSNLGRTETRSAIGTMPDAFAQYHILLEGPNNITPADGSLGNSRFLDSLNYSALGYFGFKIGPTTRIKNCKITLADNNYIAEFGTNTNWNLVKYFPAHDITINSDGIGRSGSNNLGNGWTADICGFYLDIPSEKLLSETNIIVDYEYKTTTNKNGIGFWDQVTSVGGIQFSLDSNYIGAWDNTTYGRLPSNIPPTIVTPQSNTLRSNVLYNRRIVVRTTPS